MKKQFVVWTHNTVTVLDSTSSFEELQARVIAGKEGTISAVTPAIALTAPPDVGFDSSTITQYDEQIKQHKLREAISHGRVLAKM